MVQRSFSLVAAVSIVLCAARLSAQGVALLDKPAESQRVHVSAAELVTRFEAAKYSWQQAEIGKLLVTAGDLSVIPRMAELSKVPDRKRRCNAAFVLDGLGDRRGLEILIAELQDTLPRPINPDERRGNGGVQQQIHSDRYYSANLLGTIGRDDAVPALIELLEDEQLTYVAAYSLGTLGVDGAIDEIAESADRFPQHRDTAAAALALLGDPRGLQMLSEIADSKQNYAIRCRAIDAIQKSGSVKQQAVLLKVLTDPHPNIRVAAARALKAVGDSQALPALRLAVKDEAVPPWHAPTTVSAEAIAAIKEIERREQREVEHTSSDSVM